MIELSGLFEGATLLNDENLFWTANKNSLEGRKKKRRIMLKEKIVKSRLVDSLDAYGDTSKSFNG